MAKMPEKESLGILFHGEHPEPFWGAALEHAGHWLGGLFALGVLGIFGLGLWIGAGMP